MKPLPSWPVALSCLSVTEDRPILDPYIANCYGETGNITHAANNVPVIRSRGKHLFSVPSDNQ